MVSWVGALVLYSLVIYWAFHEVCRLSVFPGSFWLWRRSLERNRSMLAFWIKLRAMCKHVSAKITLLKTVLINCLGVNITIARSSELILAINDSKKVIEGVKKNSERQMVLGVLSGSQERLYKLFKSLYAALNETAILNGDERIVFWECPDTFRYNEKAAKIAFEHKHKIEEVISLCVSICRIMNTIANTRNVFRRGYYYWFDRTLGHIDYARAELETEYGGEQAWLESFDGRKIDTMLLRGKQGGGKERNFNDKLEQTVIFCNPNAGYYEYFYDLQSQWLDFYTGHGLNIMLWNYRGYGRSEGTPSPNNLLMDGEAIVRYLRNERGVRKIVIHGQSLGGTIASSLAWKFGCEFLFADRTFSSLESVAASSFGSFANMMLRWFTGWHLDCTSKYLQTNCYKVLGNDPHDGTIHELASLKTAISLSMALQCKGMVADSCLMLTPLELKHFYEDLIYLYKVAQRTQANSHNINNGLPLPNVGNLELVDAEAAVTNLANEVLLELEKVNAAGMTLERIFSDSQKVQVKLLRVFVSNICVWGSTCGSGSEEVEQTGDGLGETRAKTIVRVLGLL
eukprot:TRINITY_DN2490_c0_g2_i1.p1 TRINITY_DN2490_c0_g2~~TRINITY_DN2490_c0_g2_i1.p1  ORF type:complete len:616 (-),score=140.52 TRINITY_DN2490_c0_g2_i1:408-2117(-)